jgi:hypothetical protein
MAGFMHRVRSAHQGPKHSYGSSSNTSELQSILHGHVRSPHTPLELHLQRGEPYNVLAGSQVAAKTPSLLEPSHAQQTPSICSMCVCITSVLYPMTEPRKYRCNEPRHTKFLQTHTCYMTANNPILKLNQDLLSHRPTSLMARSLSTKSCISQVSRASLASKGVGLLAESLAMQ